MTGYEFFMRILLLTSCSVTGSAEVLAETEDVEGLGHPRRSMIVDFNVRGFSEDQAKQLVDKHNEYRRRQGSSNMMLMEWSKDLEDHAQSYADNCVYGHSLHSHRENIGGFNIVGENIFIQNVEFEVTHPVSLWYEEIQYYRYDTSSCVQREDCGHYTQVVWANSYGLGCGVKYCKNVTTAPDDIPRGFLVVCHYGPAGNYYGIRPFLKGFPCSRCAGLAPRCSHDLCLRHEDTIDEARIRNTRPKTTDTFTEFKLNLTARVGGASFKPLRGESRRPRPSADRFGESAWPRKRCHHVITTIRSTQGRRAVIGADTRQSKSAKLVPEVKVILRSLVVAFALWSSMKDYQPNMSVT